MIAEELGQIPSAVHELSEFTRFPLSWLCDLDPMTLKMSLVSSGPGNE